MFHLENSHFCLILNEFHHYYSKLPFLHTPPFSEVPWVKCGSILGWDLFAPFPLPQESVLTLSSVIQTLILFNLEPVYSSNCWILRLMIVYIFSVTNINTQNFAFIWAPEVSFPWSENIFFFSLIPWLIWLIPLMPLGFCFLKWSFSQQELCQTSDFLFLQIRGKSFWSLFTSEIAPKVSSELQEFQPNSLLFAKCSLFLTLEILKAHSQFMMWSVSDTA